MVDSDSTHADSTLRCHGDVTDDDGEPIMNDHGHPQTCGTELTGEDHATFVRSPRGEDSHGQRLEDRFQQDALRWDCPDCGATLWTCPVCYDDRGGPGWFVGDSTGDMLACHNCNAQEAARQSRGAF